jgi:hypothetical protein
MTKHIKKYETFMNKIYPGLAALTSLTKFGDNDEIDKVILDKAISCFYKIIISAKNYKLFLSDSKIWEKITSYGLLNNLMEVIVFFFKMLTDSSKFSKTFIGLYMDIFKNTMKIFKSLCEESAIISNILLEMNILEIIYSIFKEELEFSLSNKNSLNKVKSSSHNIFNELLPFLYSLFPNKNNLIKEDRMIIDNNSNVFHFFSKKILSILIKNLVNISTSQLSLKTLKLINVYCYFSKTDNISTYLDPQNLANIMSSKNK